MSKKLRCGVCGNRGVDKGRAADGRRAYRCQRCGEVWTCGTQGREERRSEQRAGYQFCDGGAPPHRKEA